MSIDNSPNFASFWNGKLHIWHKHKPREMTVGWKVDQGGVRSRKATQARRQALLMSSELLWLLYFCKAKCFLLYTSQYEICVQMLQLPCDLCKINYRWEDWSWRISGMIRVKQQDRVRSVEQRSSAMASRERVWEQLLQRIDTTWPFLLREQQKKSGQLPEEQIQHQSPNRMVMVQGMP